MKLGFLLLFSIVAIVVLSGCLGNQVVSDSVLELEVCEDELEKNMGQIASSIELAANDGVQTHFNFELPKCFSSDSVLVITSNKNADYCLDICGGGSTCTVLLFSSPEVKKTTCLTILDSVDTPTDISICNHSSDPVDLRTSEGIKPGQYTLIKYFGDPRELNDVVCAYPGPKIPEVGDEEKKELMRDLLETKREEALRKLNSGLALTIEQFSVEVSYVLFSPGWEQIQIDFLNDRLGVGEGDGIQFASRVSQHLIFLIQPHSDGDFSISLDAGEKKDFELILDKIFDEQQADGTFLKVNNCDEGNYATCTGTFDLVIDFSEAKVSESDYQRLPKIVIEDRRTGIIISEPIFKREKVTLKFPIRLFKVLAGGNEVHEVIFNLDQENISNDFLNNEVQSIISEGSIVDYFELVSVDVKVVPIDSQGSDVTRFDVTLKFKELDPTYTYSYAYPEGIEGLAYSLPEENIYSIVLTKFFT